MKKEYLLFIIPAVTVFIIDQITKIMVASSIRYYETVTVIKGFFNLVHIRNSGMAFGLLNRFGETFGYYFFVCGMIVAILLLIYWFIRLKDENRVIIPGLALILGGAAGNLIDRIRLKEVIDFLDFHIGSYHWFSFNIADSCITMGAIWVAINLFFFDSKEN